MATAALDETAIGIYCRAHGLYAIQLTQWKDTFMTIESTTKKQDNLSELRALRIENKQLKKGFIQIETLRAYLKDLSFSLALSAFIDFFLITSFKTFKTLLNYCII